MAEHEYQYVYLVRFDENPELFKIAIKNLTSKHEQQETPNNRLRVFLNHYMTIQLNMHLIDWNNRSWNKFMLLLFHKWKEVCISVHCSYPKLYEQYKEQMNELYIFFEPHFYNAYSVYIKYSLNDTCYEPVFTLPISKKEMEDVYIYLTKYEQPLNPTPIVRLYIAMIDETFWDTLYDMIYTNEAIVQSIQEELLDTPLEYFLDFNELIERYVKLLRVFPDDSPIYAEYYLDIPHSNTTYMWDYFGYKINKYILKLEEEVKYLPKGEYYEMAKKDFEMQ
jgi:hypothetical protein